GARVSTVQVCSASELMPPPEFCARTRNVCFMSLSAWYSIGDWHGLKGPFKEHSKVQSGCSHSKRSVAVVSLVNISGPWRIVTWGAMDDWPLVSEMSSGMVSEVASSKSTSSEESKVSRDWKGGELSQAVLEKRS